MADTEIQLWQTVAPVEFSPKVKDKTEAQSLLIAARQGAGYQVAGGQVSHALQNRATHVLMDYSQTACAIRYQIDGQWEQLPPIDRETGDAMLYALKQLAQLNPADRRSAQKGKIGAKLNKDKCDLTLQTQGVPTGERVLIKIDLEKVPFERLSDLGMRDKMVETFKTILNSDSNMVLVTAPKGGGLTTTWSIVLNVADKFVRDFQSFEDEDLAEPETINVNQNFFGGSTGMSLHERVRKAILKEPDVFVFPETPDPETMKLAVDQVAGNEKQIITRAVATSAIAGYVETLHRFPDQIGVLADKTDAVLAQKLVRRLCDQCKVGFQPPPQLLQQLGIPPGRVAELYQPFVLPPVEQQVDEQGRPAPIEPCPECNGRGYLGRVAIFELLRPGEQLKAAVKKSRDLGQLSQIAKSEGHKTLQAEAVLTVARGLTDLNELKRAFSGG